MVVIFNIVVFVIVLGVLVLVHEWGHFITARKSGMKVYEFGFGFPPRAFGMYKDPKTKKWIFVTGKGKNRISETVGGGEKLHPDEFPATLYSFNWLPIGGFVKIKGENGEDVAESDSFGYHPYWKKAIVLVAGVVMNVVLAIVVLSAMYMIGKPLNTPVHGALTGGYEAILDDPHVIVVEPVGVFVRDVKDGFGAADADIKSGDQVLAVGDREVFVQHDVPRFLQDIESESAALTVSRGGKLIVQDIVLTEEDGGKRFGIHLEDRGKIRYPWHIAIWRGIVDTFKMIWLTILGLALVIKNLVTGQGAGADVAGPVGIAVQVGISARLGFAYLLEMVALLSVSLAVINVLPIPALDGGRLLFVSIEKIFKRPVPMRYEQIAHTVGFVLLMALIVLVTVRDVMNLF